MKLFAEITKIDPVKRLVYGYASTEAMDSQGEKVSKAALEAALPDYMRFANVREMHQPSAVGVAKEADIDDKGLYLCAKVVDDPAWEKVKEGVYKGFSIGGRKVEKVDDTITSLKLTEISLVDRPANPECVFDMVKGFEAGQVAPAEQAPVNDLAKYLGDEAWDASRALDALTTIYSLFARESQESHPEAAEQLAALQAVIDNLKTFIASEIKETEPVSEAGTPVLMAEAPEDIKKRGARNSKPDSEKIQGIHDHSVGLGAKCGGVAGKAMDAEDLKKFEEMANIIAKLRDDNDALVKRITELEGKPAPAKAAVTAVSKEEDTAKGENVALPETNDPMELIKRAQGNPIIPISFVGRV